MQRREAQRKTLRLRVLAFNILIFSLWFNKLKQVLRKAHQASQVLISLHNLLAVHNVEA